MAVPFLTSAKHRKINHLRTIIEIDNLDQLYGTNSADSDRQEKKTEDHNRMKNERTGKTPSQPIPVTHFREREAELDRLRSCGC